MGLQDIGLQDIMLKLKDKPTLIEVHNLTILHRRNVIQKWNIIYFLYSDQWNDPYKPICENKKYQKSV